MPALPTKAAPAIVIALDDGRPAVRPAAADALYTLLDCMGAYCGLECGG